MRGSVGTWTGNRQLLKSLNVLIVRKDTMGSADTSRGHVLNVENWDIGHGSARIEPTEGSWRPHRLIKPPEQQIETGLPIVGDGVAEEGLGPGLMQVKQLVTQSALRPVCLLLIDKRHLQPLR